MKIAFTGMSSTGKTTTAKTLLQYKNFYELEIPLLKPTDTRARISVPIDEMSDNERLLYQKFRFDEKIQLEEKQENFLVERSFIDLLAYRKLVPVPLEKDEEQKYITLAKAYDVHFFFPPNIVPYISDGKRPSLEFSRKTSDIIYEMLNLNNISYIELRNTTILERCDVICRTLNQMKGTK